MAEEVRKSFAIFRGRGRGVKVELNDRPLPVYVYEDERLRLEIPVPPFKIFLAFVKELDRLGAEPADAEECVTILARAFWLLHQRPRRWGPFRRRQEMPTIDDDAALKLLNKKVRRSDVAFKSLVPALFGLVRYVTQKG